MTVDVEAIRREIPLLNQPSPPAFLDNACMTLKPRPVIDAVVEGLERWPVCAGRAAYDLARELGERVHGARRDVARVLGARDPSRMVFTKNATESVNLVAHAFRLRKGDVVVTSDREHNSNFVTWHEACRRTGAVLEVFPTRDDGTFDEAAFEARLAAGDVRLVAMGHASNLDGTVLPADAIVRIAHAHGARVLLDGAQAAGHMPVDVEALGVDFYAASSHKMFGPTGVGFLYLKEGVEDEMGAFIVGGDTVEGVTYESVTFREVPARFEAGLQNYAGILGAGAAARYLARIGAADIHAHEVALNRRMTLGLDSIPGIRILGPPAPEDRGGILTFTYDHLGPHEIAILLDDRHNVQVRSGAHCVHAWFHARDIEGSVRASVYAYTSADDVDRFVAGVREIADKVGP